MEKPVLLSNTIFASLLSLLSFVKPADYDDVDFSIDC